MELRTTEEYLRNLGYAGPCTAIVLGTGLGALVNIVEVEVETAYESIPGFPEATIEFHKGRFIKGRISGHSVLIMQGRFHYYEGYSMEAITFPIRVMKALGARRLLLSNAAGCLNMDWKKGDLMLVDDHINLLPEDPLLGPNDETQGPRFPDMSEAYSSSMKGKLIQLAAEMNMDLRCGIYSAVQGPNLETAAEYRMLKLLGADAVGMSTVPEVKVANHIGLPCAAISVLTDMCNPDALEPVDIQDIISTAMKSEEALISLMLRFLENIHEY